MSPAIAPSEAPAPAGLKGHPSAGGGLLEEHGEGFALERRLVLSGLVGLAMGHGPVDEGFVGGQIEIGNGKIMLQRHA